MKDYKDLNSRVKSELNEVMETETIKKNGMKFKMKRIFLGAAIGFSMVSGFAQKQYLNSIINIQNNKMSFLYDSKGYCILRNWDNWDKTTNDWIRYRKLEYAYDNRGNQTMSLVYLWNPTTNDWMKIYKFEYTYDDNNNQTMEIYSQWDNGTNDWRGIEKNEDTYDNKDNQTMRVRYTWDNATTDWMKSQKYEYIYNDKECLTLCISYRWDNITNNWTESNKTEYTYDNNDNLTMQVDSIWNNGMNVWKEAYKTEYTYDNNGNQIMYVYSQWDNETNDWKGLMRYGYDYDLSYSITDLIMPSYISNSYNSVNMRTKQIPYGWSGSDWVEGNTSQIWYWSDKNVGIVETGHAPSLRVYPNPTSNQLRITNYELQENTEIQIFDIVGKRQNAECRKAESEITIDISHLANGLYFLKIDNKTVKIVKE